MGLVKIGQRTLGDSIRFKQSSESAVDNNKQDDDIMLGLDRDDDSDDSEIAETGCEYGMVGDQQCSVPYELYELPDLKGILCLETWNSCLTEEDRFSLSLYLPDMDQQTFWLTMTELLSGKNMFFGSPLTEFFNRLKSGFYPPKVNHFREGLQFLQRRAFYHSLRSYQENMVSTFSEMKIAWSKCQPSFSVEERIRIWNAWKNQKAKGRVDLNAFPLDNDTLCSSSTMLITGPVVKKIKYPPAESGMAMAPLKTNGKGVLKIKPAGMNSTRTGMVCRPVPKGVLKVVAKGPLDQLQQWRGRPNRQKPTTSADVSMQTFTLSPLPQSVHGMDADYREESPFLSQTIRKAYPTVEVSKCTTGRQQMEYLNSTTGLVDHFENTVRKIKWTKDREMAVTGIQEQNLLSKNSHTVKYTHGGIGIGETLNSGNIWRNLGQEKIDYYHDPGEQKMASMHEKLIPIYPRISEAVPRISGSNVGGHQLSTESLDQSNGRHRDGTGGCLEKAHDNSAVSQGIRDGVELPITYKRRKTCSKVDPLGFVRLPSRGTDFESRTVEETNRHLDAKAIKIQFKNWKDHKPFT